MVRLRWMTVLMVLVMLVIAGFQVYWLAGNYRHEKNGLESRANFILRDAVRDIQDSVNRSRIQQALKDSVNVINMPRPAQRSGYVENATNVVRLLSQAPRDTTTITQNLKRGQLTSITLKTMNAGSDSARQFRFNLDSMPPGNIREMVVINPGESGKSIPALIDSIKFSKQPAPGTTKLAPHLSMPRRPVRKAEPLNDSVRSRITQVNTIYMTNERGNQILLSLDSLLIDSIPQPLLETRVKWALQQEKITVPFTITHEPAGGSTKPDSAGFRPTFPNRGRYHIETNSNVGFLLNKIRLPILFSAFLVGITLLSFIFLYRSLRRQQRLSQMKSDLMSNITHELKTPIATVGVAIEALKNFNAIQDPQRTREYLDISQNELQRLSLLVDKVLKLSMFEKKEMEIKREVFDLGQLVDEVVTSLRLQTEKYRAQMDVDTTGDLQLKADRLHLQSVVFNLLDNALKYSKENPLIKISLAGTDEEVKLQVQDNGIGIPDGYRDKVFEKFFRVPTGDTHNAKGHGLGLSYVAQVVKQHGGSINLESHEGLGSTFTIIIPKNPA